MALSVERLSTNESVLAELKNISDRLKNIEELTARPYDPQPADIFTFPAFGGYEAMAAGTTELDFEQGKAKMPNGTVDMGSKLTTAKVGKDWVRSGLIWADSPMDVEFVGSPGRIFFDECDEIFFGPIAFRKIRFTNTLPLAIYAIFSTSPVPFFGGSRVVTHKDRYSDEVDVPALSDFDTVRCPVSLGPLSFNHSGHDDLIAAQWRKSVVHVESIKSHTWIIHNTGDNDMFINFQGCLVHGAGYANDSSTGATQTVGADDSAVIYSEVPYHIIRMRIRSDVGAATTAKVQYKALSP